MRLCRSFDERLASGQDFLHGDLGEVVSSLDEAEHVVLEVALHDANVVGTDQHFVAVAMEPLLVAFRVQVQEFDPVREALSVVFEVELVSLVQHILLIDAKFRSEVASDDAARSPLDALVGVLVVSQTVEVRLIFELLLDLDDFDLTCAVQLERDLALDPHGLGQLLESKVVVILNNPVSVSNLLLVAVLSQSKEASVTVDLLCQVKVHSLQVLSDVMVATQEVLDSFPDSQSHLSQDVLLVKGAHLNLVGLVCHCLENASFVL